MAWHSTTYKVQKKLTSTMLNRQMFGTKKLATHHPTSWNKPPKVHVSNWTENSHTRSASHHKLTTIKSFWLCLRMGENWIPKVEWQIISQLPNQPLTSKTFCPQKFCTFMHKYFSSPKTQQCKWFVNPIPYAKDMNFRKNSKWKWKSNFCLVLKVKSFDVHSKVACPLINVHIRSLAHVHPLVTFN
jgi:hypothetical protein